MNWRRAWAIATKELLQIRRDSRSLAIVIAMPVILLFAFGYGVSFDTKNIPVYVYDQEGSQASQNLLKHFQASEYFHVVRSANSYKALEDAIDRGECGIAVVIPWNFSHQLNMNPPVHVQALVDATDSNTANVGMTYVQAVIQSYSQHITMDWMQKQGRLNASVPLSVDARTLFNENLESAANIVPGVVAVIMAVVGTFLTSLTIAREWERGTMEQLISTPVKPLELMIGKLAPYVVIGMADTLLCAAMGVWWFQVPFRGEWWVFTLSSFLFLAVVLSMGYTISVVAKSQLAASQVSLVATFLPAFLLSGFIFPIDQMPAVIRAVTHLLPARYFMTIARDVFLKGTPLALIREELLILAGFAAILGFIATRAFRKTLG